MVQRGGENQRVRPKRIGCISELTQGVVVAIEKALKTGPMYRAKNFRRIAARKMHIQKKYKNTLDKNSRFARYSRRASFLPFPRNTFQGSFPYPQPNKVSEECWCRLNLQRNKT